MSAKWFVKLVRGPVITFLKKRLEDQSFLIELADIVNEKVDIPNVTEETEAQMFRSYMVATAKALVEYLEKI